MIPKEIPVLMQELDYDKIPRKDSNNRQPTQSNIITNQAQQLVSVIPKIRAGNPITYNPMLTDDELHSEIFQQSVTQEDLQMLEKLKLLNGALITPKQIVDENEMQCLLQIKSMADKALTKYRQENQDQTNIGLQTFHFSKYNAKIKDLQVECSLTGLRMHLRNANLTLKQPQKNDVIEYLANAFLSYNKVNPDKDDGKVRLKTWLEHIQGFFSWTASRNTYPNIAQNISVQEIINKSAVMLEQEKTAKEQAKIASEATKKIAAKAQADRNKQKRKATWTESRKKEIIREKARMAKAIAAAEEEESEPEIDEIAPQPISPNWTEEFVEDIGIQVKGKAHQSIKTMMNVFRCYLIEYNINEINKLSMLKFMALYKDVHTFNSIIFNNSTLKRFFNWTSSEEAPDDVVGIKNVDALIPTYKNIIRFKRSARKAGNERLGKASFNYNWLEQFLLDIERSENPKCFNIPILHINSLQEYLTKKVPNRKPMPSDILDFLVLEKYNIAEDNMHTYLSTYQKLFKWTSIKTNQMGNMYYPDIIGNTLQRGILGKLVSILRREYDLSKEKPAHPTAEYFKDFEQTITQPYDGRKAIDFENFVKYLQEKFKIQPPVKPTASNDSDTQ